MRGILVIASVLAFSGCASLYDIHRGAEKVEGVPFYVLAGACLQESVYLETLYQVSVHTPAVDKVPPIVLMEKIVPASTYASTAMQRLRDSVTSGTAQLSDIRGLFAALPTYSPTVPPETTAVSNLTKAERFVDYGKVHYVNVKRPWIGSATATAKLNGDGTLSEYSATVEDTTVETLLSAIPLKEVLLGAIGGADFLPAAVGTGLSRPLQLVVTPTRFRHVLTKSERASPPCAAKPMLAMSDETANRRREAVSDSGSKESEPENAISVTGQIVLPKKAGG